MDLYEKLGVPADADLASIKKAYQRLSLQCHPDKLPLDTGECDRQAALTAFQDIKEAWHVLGDQQRREQYDKERAAIALTRKWPVSAELDIEEVEYAKDDESYSWPCRCSGLYTVTQHEMEEGCNVVCCSNCSLSVHITNHDRLSMDTLATSK